MGGAAQNAFVQALKAQVWALDSVSGARQAGVAEDSRPLPATPKSAQRQTGFFFSAPFLNPPVSPFLFTAGRQVGDKRESGTGSGNQTMQ